MAGLQGFGAGLLQGYGAVSRIQDRKRARDQQQQRIDAEQQYRHQQMGLEQQRHEDQQAWRQDRLKARQGERDYQHKRDAIGDERWDQQFGLKQSQAKADNRRADARLGIARQNADISAANAATNAKMGEVKLAHARRQEREADNRRHLAAATQELQQNGVTPRFRDLSQKGGVDVDNMLDPKWQQSREALTAGLQGAPISRDKMVAAGNTFFHDRIERMVGSQTGDGKTIVRTQLKDFYPGKDGESAVMDLDVWTKDKNGHVEKYNAPATSNRRDEDDYVLHVPMKQVVGHIKAMDVANKAVDKHKLAGVIAQQQTLNGANDPGEADGDWARGPDNTLFNRKTGKTQKIETEGNENKRYSKALKYAQKDLRAAEADRYSGPLKDKNEAQKQQWLLKRRNMYLGMMTPGDRSDSPDGQPGSDAMPKPQSEAEFQKLASGTKFVAPDGSTRVKP